MPCVPLHTGPKNSGMNSGAESDYNRDTRHARTLHGMPRWLVVVLPAILLFLGLILTGGVAWVGGILLFILWVFVAWLTALSWPALTAGQKVFRTIVVLAMLGLVVLKLMGRF